MISIVALVLVISIGFLVPMAVAQLDKYSKMAPVEQYLIERNAEILLARSAAPDSISSDATILVLGRQGYETAVRGKNGFVCMVERSWMAAFDSLEFWNPKVRGAECLNRQAARSILPIADLRTRMVMAGHSKADIVSALKARHFAARPETFIKLTPPSECLEESSSQACSAPLAFRPSPLGRGSVWLRMSDKLQEALMLETALHKVALQCRLP
jgi:hypothetical protein